MKVNVSVLIGCVLCVVMIAGIRVLRSVDEHHDMWRPNDIYSQVGGSTFSSVSYSPSPAVSSGVSVSISAGSNSLFRRRAPYFNARVSNPSPMAYGQSPISVGGSSAGAIHTTSSAQYRSFGSGAGAGVSMSGGTVRANASQPSASMASVSMPSVSTPIFTYASSTVESASVADNDLMLTETAYDLASAIPAYAGIGNTTAGGPMGMRGRRNSTIGGGFTGWFEHEYWLDSGHEFNGYDITEEDLRQLYAAITGDTDFSNNEQWISFLEWFNSMQDDDTFGWYWVPVPDAISFVLLLCLMYGYVVYRRAKKQQKV